VSLLLPAIALPGGEAYAGFRVLLEGWRSVALGIPSWCANPLLVLALGLLVTRYDRAATLVSGLSLVFAVSSVAAPWFAGLNSVTLPDFQFRTGFFLWLSSPFAVFAGAGCRVWQSSRRRPQSAQDARPLARD
jgi:hypothetical protein